MLLDLSLPDSDGLETFAEVYAHRPTVPIIVLTGNDDQNGRAAAVKSGAQDYLVKGRLDRELLLRSMHYSIERKRYQEQLEHQANYDALTGLPNRNLLHDRLRAVGVRSASATIAVVFIDLDRFKVVNDTLGHHRRPAAQGMAERLRASAARGRHRRTPGRRRVRADPQRPVERGDPSAPCSASCARCRADRDRRQGAVRHLQRRASACIRRTATTSRRC